MKGRPPKRPKLPGPPSRRPLPPPVLHQRQRPATTALPPEEHVFGRHAVAAVLEHQRARAQRLWLLRSAELGDLEDHAAHAHVPTELVDAATLDALTGKGAVHQGAVLRCAPYPYVAIEDFERAPALTLVLDGIEDPRNLGAAARAAFVLGASLVVIPHDRAAGCTASAHKAAVGALSRIAVARVGNLRRALEQLQEKGAWLVGAEADATAKPWEIDMTGQVALVVGGEDRGLRRLTRELCDHVVAIPMTGGDDMSLNAADAATVLLYEVLRQRNGPVTRP